MGTMVRIYLEGSRPFPLALALELINKSHTLPLSN